MATVSAVPKVPTTTGLTTPMVMAPTKGSSTAIMGAHHQMFGAHHHMEKQSMQHAILFLQQEHSRTLTGLHTEIKHLQSKCSDMTAQIALQNINAGSPRGPTERSASPNALKKKFESEIRSLRKDATIAQSQLEEKEKKITFLESQLRSREQRYQDELKTLQHKRTELEHQLEIKSASIAHLTSQLHKTKVKQIGGQVYQSPRRAPASANATDSAAAGGENTQGVVRRVKSRRQKSSVPSNLLNEATNNTTAGLEKSLTENCSLEEGNTQLTPVPPIEDKQGKLTRSNMSRRTIPPSRSSANSRPRPPGYEEMIRISQSSSSNPKETSQLTAPKNARGVLPPISSPSNRK